MTRKERVEAVAVILFRHRGCPGLLPGDRLDAGTVHQEDLDEAERFLDMLAAADVLFRYRPRSSTG